MAQLTIYLDEETQRKVEDAARRESISLSRWAREHLLKAAESETASAWGHLSRFSGCVDETFQPPARGKNHREVPEL